MKIRRILASLLALGIVMVLAAAGTTPTLLAQGGEFDLTIAHTNDTHARLMPITAFNSDCNAQDDAAGKCFGGVARRATALQKIRAEGKNLLVLDAGDQFQGSLFYYLYKGEEAAKFLNELGFQATTFGNHEFDDGPANVARYIEMLKLPLVSANVDVSAEPTLAGKVKPYAILEAGGEKIGVTGCTTTDTPILSSPGANVKFNAIAASVKAQVAALEKEGINKIVLLCHEGYDPDKALAAAVDGIDVIVGGHSHSYLSSNPPDQDKDKALGPYPTVVKSPNGDPVLIVQAMSYGKYLGRLDVTFDAKGVPTKWEGAPILLDASVTPDPKIAEEVAKLDAPLQELRNKVIGQSSVDLNNVDNECRFGECNIGDLIADAMLDSQQKEGVQVAMLNGGGIRASIPKGDVTLGQVLTVLPFGNTIATFGLKGSDLRAALENGVSRAENPGNEGTGRFPQVAGMTYVWNPQAPVGSRIVSVQIKQPDGTYQALDPNATYKVATLDFTRQGGDGYSVFGEKAIDPYDFGPTLADVVAAYIGVHSPVASAVEGRITQGTAAPTTTLPSSGAALPNQILYVALALGGALLLVLGALLYRRSVR
ncbi:multifunctional 2',3'-cyclic-nucleotide 2'-phosphodiesterase/5'-nucleotidase/3'-nucleotidase [Anaerolineae bacterium CFX7]|nr:multifunctional 2',3'-cyclic-nucleotide 2'-phosphodiesterase/5'-nucleotidase/3'-nucleotidase [Anaerolineae bacterium CFX7]